MDGAPLSRRIAHVAARALLWRYRAAFARSPETSL